MHADFADWYRRVAIEPRADDLTKRWQGIDSFHGKATASDLADAARLFFGLAPRDEGFLPKYRAEFKSADNTFAMRNNDAELQVLAGATLANHSDDGGAKATLATLALVCGACEGARKAPVPEIVELARDSLVGHSSYLRAAWRRPAIPSLNVDAELKHLKNALEAGGAPPTLQEPLMNVLQPLVKTLIGVTNSMRQAKQFDDLRQEESDILWWLFGERSRDLCVPFCELKQLSGCLVGPKEIADLTRVLPGPVGVEAYLHKMLRLAHPTLPGAVSLSDAVAACSLEWHKQFTALAGVAYVSDLCPVHLAALKCIESGGKKSVWAGPFQTLSGLKATMKLDPVKLAVQAYRERLFVRLMVQVQESSDG